MTIRKVVKPKPKERRPPTPTRREWVTSHRVLTLMVAGIKKGGYDISHCLDRDPVELIPEPDNAYDPHAIRVVSASGGMLGYVPADYAVAMNAADWTAVIAAVLPHPKTGAPAGLRLRLTRRAPEEDGSEEIQEAYE